MCAFADIKTSAPQSQPIFPKSAPEQDTNMNMSLWLWVLIFIVLCLLYYHIRNWRNQPERNAEYEVVELALTQNEPSDNPLIHSTTAQSPEESSEH